MNKIGGRPSDVAKKHLNNLDPEKIADIIIEEYINTEQTLSKTDNPKSLYQILTEQDKNQREM